MDGVRVLGASPSTISPTLNAMKLIATLTRQVWIAGAVDLHDRVLAADRLRARRANALASGFAADRREIRRRVRRWPQKRRVILDEMAVRWTLGGIGGGRFCWANHSRAIQQFIG